MKQIINMQITSSCNYTCGMCPFHGEGYSADYFQERPEWKREMSLEEVEAILIKAKEAGIEKIDFTPNGEFFTYKKWREVLALVQKYGMQSTLTTNGGLLSEQDIKDAIELGLSHVAISIDSVHYDTYKICKNHSPKNLFKMLIRPQFFLNNIIILVVGGVGIYVQVQFTEQPENKQEVKDMLDFYRPHKLDQITVNKMFETTEQGIIYKDVARKIPKYKVGTCKSYGGSYLVQTNGSVLGCCGEFYFYPKIKSKVPNIFKQSLQECQKQSDHLYLNDIDFINYCKNCSLYAVNNSEVLERKFIESGYFAMQYATQTRYFIIPEYLRSIPQNILLFMYEKGMVSEIKEYVRGEFAD